MSGEISRRNLIKNSFILGSAAFWLSCQKDGISDSHKLSELNYDIVICGGGPGGVCASVAAARLNMRVLLIERYGFLGGMATAGLVQPFMTFYAGNRQIIRGVFEEIRQRLEKRGGYLFQKDLHNGGGLNDVGMQM